MIKDMGNVVNSRWWDVLCHSESQIPILRALYSLPEPPHGTEDISSVDAQVTHHVLGSKEIRVPVRFEIRAKTPTLLVNFILVGIDHVGLWKFLEGESDHVEGMFRQFVIVIEKCDE